MRLLLFQAVATIIFAHCSAHYVFGRFIFNNTITKTWEYVRPVDGYQGKTNDDNIVWPNQDPLSEDIRCGRNASATGKVLGKTAKINAGDKVGFAVGDPKMTFGSPVWQSLPPHVLHPGPGSVWLSKAPTDDLDAYKGDGDWFKILQVVGEEAQSPGKLLNTMAGDEIDLVWGMYQAQSWNFTIPRTTPPGKYLLRMEHFYSRSPNEVQFYTNCAQVEIMGPGGGTPGPLVKIPGVYKVGQKEVYAATNSGLTGNFSTYLPPAPSVWRGDDPKPEALKPQVAFS
ncbi:hypothetical protein CC78DRAFT_549787 [Lojkania enalia]|uniref:lytic cellulose monooxygenase (C4-dehydrogenating) n=1 Tax=Lojkania enalia TaxID=147567 RepID=A0A9P4JWA6_9PLEO|nr:hypothetical protein CC78DRAFT_549787 [Didymosphaeria enalia]